MSSKIKKVFNLAPFWLSSLTTLCHLFLAIFTQIIINLPLFGKGQDLCLCIFANPITAVWYIFLSLSYPCILQKSAPQKKFLSGSVICSESSFKILCLAPRTFSFILKLFSSSNSWRSGDLYLWFLSIWKHSNWERVGAQ